MNITKIGITQPQKFTGNYKSKAKNALYSFAAATAILAATQKSEAQNMNFSMQPGAIPTEDWYSTYQRQMEQHGALIYTDPFGQRYVSYTDYMALKSQYNEFIKNNPLPNKAPAKTPKISNTTSNTPPSIESIRKQAETEHKTTKNIITICAIILGFFSGPKLLSQIIRKVSK